MNRSKNEKLMARKAAATPRGVGVMGNFFADRAENATLWDVEGREFIDFAGGIAVLNTGHRHPKVMAAIAAQMQRFTHTCYQVVPYESYIALAEKINQITPGNYPKKTAFFSTGAEAIENAIKIARSYTKRSGVIAFSGAFHGRSLFAVSLTGKVQPYKAGFGPFAPEVYHAPFPCHCSDLNEVKKAVHNIFKSDIEPSRVAAIVFEPVQGEGGFNIIQAAAVQWLRALCDEYGIMLIADEIQTGFARTGKMFAMQHFEVQPDLMTIAKSLAGGMTLSAVTGKAQIMDAPAPGGLGGTYAGNPLAIAAAHAVIDVIEQEKLCERSEQLGSKLKTFIQQQRKDVPQIADVRGLGSMVACEFNQPGTDTPDPGFTKAVQTRALAENLILLTCGVNANVIRFLYPLTIPDEQFERALKIVARALRA
jgi:4-aminobutyrate aminotransferase